MDLTCISNLSQLRYLKVDGSDIVLPGQIQGLKFLETLELPKAHSSNIPSDIVELPRLSHLIVSCERGLPDGIGKAKTLCTLCFFSLLDSSLDSVVSLGKLTALSELRLECTAIRFNGYGPLLAALSASLEKLGNLKRLFVGHSYRFAISSRSYDASCVDDALMSWHSPPFRNLEQLGLEDWIFSSFPRWIGRLHSLWYLHLGVKQIHQEDLGVMGKLPSLLELHLGTLCGLTERIVIGGSTGQFKFLRWFEFNCVGASSYLTFEAGAMPNLRRLWLAFDTREWEDEQAIPGPGGLHHLSSLEEIQVKGALCDGNTRSEPTPDDVIIWPARIKRLFQAAAHALPTRPTVTYGGWLVR
ncbi:hypothetical protein QOZ80_8AG0614600 [Eleusine coracana subsp. coracana]|nr:hypothetical protein QOZ80_8AG0614600 [Eleusine coracana subsp. coracana]